MHTVLVNRDRELTRVRRALGRLHSLRLQMMLIVALTGAAGFLASVLLLYGGVTPMALRYPLAIGLAYIAFLFFLWCWLRLRWQDIVDVPNMHFGGSSADVSPPWQGGGGHYSGGGASGTWDGGDRAISSLEDGGFTSDSMHSAASSDSWPDIGDAAGALDAEELTVVIIALVTLAAAAVAAVWIVWLAPALFAEITLDAALATGLYRRLRTIEGAHWLRTAIRRTVWPFVGVALIFSLAGAAMHAYAPEARSIGQVIKHIKTD